VILHIAPQEKFISPFNNFLGYHFEDFEQSHRFWIQISSQKYQLAPAPNVIFEEDLARVPRWARLIWEIHKADKIILHGLFNSRLVRLLALQPWILKKCYWVMWGGDLYAYQNEAKSLDSYIKEFFRKIVIRRLGHLVTYLEGDVDLARQWYGARGQYHHSFMYPSNLYVENREENLEKQSINILIGNSADPSNNHLEILKILEPYREENILIYAPLSYGDSGYADGLAVEGRRVFGEKFVPLMDFMPLDEYQKLLARIDIAMFNHRRQQGMGNSISLLGMGKRIFMRSAVTPYRMFSDLGVKVFDIEKFELAKLSAADGAHNAQRVKSIFSEEQLISQLKKIFRG
jgi:dTDP-N-acetylfucosamine:lipid II N-acetylfucosaminyltransferase